MLLAVETAVFVNDIPTNHEVAAGLAVKANQVQMADASNRCSAEVESDGQGWPPRPADQLVDRELAAFGVQTDGESWPPQA